MSAPSRGAGPKVSKLQTKEERGKRAAARCQPYETRPTGVATATETVTVEWVCAVTTGTATETVTVEWVCAVTTGAATETVTV